MPVQNKKTYQHIPSELAAYVLKHKLEKSFQIYMHLKFETGSIFNKQSDFYKTIQKVKNYLKYDKPMMPKKRRIKVEKPALKQMVMDLEKENPIKKGKLTPEDKWKLEALEAQLAWVKSSVIPIPNKKG